MDTPHGGIWLHVISSFSLWVVSVSRIRATSRSAGRNHRTRRLIVKASHFDRISRMCGYFTGKQQQLGRLLVTLLDAPLPSTVTVFTVMLLLEIVVTRYSKTYKGVVVGRYTSPTKSWLLVLLPGGNQLAYVHRVRKKRNPYCKFTN